MAENKTEKKTRELDKVLPTKATLKIHGKEREFKFGFSAWAKIEKEYGGLKNITKLEKDIEDTPFEIIPHLMYLALVDKEGVTEENILDEYGLNDMHEVMQVFEKAFYGSLPVDTEKKTDKMKR